MISDAEAEAFLGSISAGVLKDLTGLAFPGSNTATAIAPYAARVFYRALKKYNLLDVPALLDALARLPFKRAFAVVETQAARSDLDEEVKREAVKYLSAVPMTSRQALHRFDDGGHVTTLVSQVPQTLEQVERLMPLRTPRFQPGDRVPGHDYKLEMLLGQGGFAEVWKARHTELKGRPPVALKFCLDNTLLPSLQREIELVGALQDYDADKDIVSLIDTAYTAEPPFLIYEYIDGGNLCGWIDSFGEGVPTPKDVISVLKMAARAMAEAHGRNIAHRDLKPANLLITRAGRVKVGDFGIGRVVAAGGGQADGRTADQGRDGGTATLLRHAHTPVYTDPRRDPAQPAGLSDDVYALGVIGYQLLAGNATARMEGGWRRYLEARGAPAALIDIIETCVAPPDERYADAGALLSALEVLGKTAKKKPKGARTKPRQAPPPTPDPEPAPKTKAKVKYCHRCGSRVLPSRQYCTDCGYRVPR